jgi:hypothetical protein
MAAPSNTNANWAQEKPYKCVQTVRSPKETTQRPFRASNTPGWGPANFRVERLRARRTEPSPVGPALGSGPTSSLESPAPPSAPARREAFGRSAPASRQHEWGGGEQVGLERGRGMGLVHGAPAV